MVQLKLKFMESELSDALKLDKPHLLNSPQRKRVEHLFETEELLLISFFFLLNSMTYKLRPVVKLVLTLNPLPRSGED